MAIGRSASSRSRIENTVKGLRRVTLLGWSKSPRKEPLTYFSRRAASPAASWRSIPMSVL